MSWIGDGESSEHSHSSQSLVGPHYLILGSNLMQTMLIEPKYVFKNILHQIILKWTHNCEYYYLD